MPDMDLNDDMVKLVEYSIVTIQRQQERVLGDPERRVTIVTDNLTGNAFSNARIAELVNDKKHKRLKPDTLRVYYNVLERWPKEDLKKDEKGIEHDEEQIKVLRQIRDRL